MPDAHDRLTSFLADLQANPGRAKLSITGMPLGVLAKGKGKATEPEGKKPFDLDEYVKERNIATTRRVYAAMERTRREPEHIRGGGPHDNWRGRVGSCQPYDWLRRGRGR